MIKNIVNTIVKGTCKEILKNKIDAKSNNNSEKVLEGEVCDVPKKNEKLTNLDSKQIRAIVLMAASLLYNFLPVDLVPFIPIDNVGIFGIAATNLMQQFLKNSTLILALKYLKWILILLTIIAVLIFGGIITLLVS